MQFNKNLHPPAADSIFIECLVSARVSGAVVSKLKTIIMNKEQERTELERMMRASNIFKSLSVLNQVLKAYELRKESEKTVM